MIITTDWKFPGSYDTYSGGSNTDWSNLERITVEDGAVASSGINKNAKYTFFIRAHNFNFGIPVGGSIIGIETIIKKSRGNTSNPIIDNTIQLLKYDEGGIGDNLASGTGWSTTLTDSLYGGEESLWGLESSYLDSIINTTNFGLLIRAYVSGGSTSTTDARIDVVRMRVSYDYTPPLSVIGPFPTFFRP